MAVTNKTSREYLIDDLLRLTESEEDQYEEIPEEAKLEALTDEAALFILDTGIKVWFPKSQLRELDGFIYASTWIIEQKEMEF